MPVSVALCSFEGPPEDGFSPFSGGYGEGETPLPIPNRAVKPLSADGTWPSRARESRTPPVSLITSRPSGRLVVVNGAYDPPRARPDRPRRQPRRAADAARRGVPARLHGPAVQHRRDPEAPHAGHGGRSHRRPWGLRRAALPIAAAGGVLLSRS